MYASASGSAEYSRDLDAPRRPWDLDEVIGTVGLSISAALWLARSARLGSEELATRLVDEALLTPSAEPRRRSARAAAR